MKWPITIIIDDGENISAIAPMVISASRLTDIPNYYVKWFMNALNRGWCMWQNPHNKTYRYVSFENTKAIVFWTKNPKPILQYLPEIDKFGYKYYFQYTLNDYGRVIEPMLTPKDADLGERILTFKRLSDMIGPEKVIWRYDPIILGDFLDVNKTLRRIRNIAEEIAPYTEKLIFSFIDTYKHVQKGLDSCGIGLRAPTEKEMHQLAEGIAEIRDASSSKFKIATCAETIDFDRLGIEHGKCIDPELISRICGDDNSLKEILPINDSGQRKACGCMPSKDIGAYNTCLNFCRYCYATKTPTAALIKLLINVQDRTYL